MENVEAGFGQLIEGVRMVELGLNAEHSAAARSGDDVQKRQILKALLELTDLTEQITSAHATWRSLNLPQSMKRPISAGTSGPDDMAPPSASLAPARVYVGRSRVEALPKEEYWIPILSVLVEFGGRAHKQEVLHNVRERVKHRLNAADYEPTSKQQDPRWFNRASWARQDMVLEGLLAADSARGEWEVTDKGRKYLKDHSQA